MTSIFPAGQEIAYMSMLTEFTNARAEFIRDFGREPSNFIADEAYKPAFAALCTRPDPKCPKGVTTYAGINVIWSIRPGVMAV